MARARWLCTGIALALGGIGTAHAAATGKAAYPEKPVRVIVSFAAGTGSDILARVVTDYLRAAMGVKIGRAHV